MVTRHKSKTKKPRLTRRPGKFAFWIYLKDFQRRVGTRVRRKGEPVVIQAYTKRQAVSWYVRAFLELRGKEAVNIAENYFARIVTGGGIGSQTELPHKP